MTEKKSPAKKVAKKPPAKVKAKLEKEKPKPSLEKDVIGAIHDSIGEEGAQFLGSNLMAMKIRGVISTRAKTLDIAIGRGGVPLSRLTILHGGEGSGKTTLALQLVAEVQAKGGLAVYFDTEYKLDPEYAANLGVNRDKIIISQPRTLEDVFKAMNHLIARVRERRESSGKRNPILIVLDSINATIAKAVLDGEVGDAHIAPEARIWSRHLPKIIEQCHKEDIALVLISQVRSKINVMFGSNEDLAGGNAPRFYASLIMYVKRIGHDKGKDGQKTANITEVECRKNQIAPPFKKAKIHIVYGEGVDWERSLIQAGIERELVTKSGAQLKFNGKSIGQGYAAACELLRSDSELAEELEKAIDEAVEEERKAV